MDRIIDFNGIIIRISFVLSLAAFIYGLSRPLTAYDGGGSFTLKNRCAANMSEVMKNISPGFNSGETGGVILSGPLYAQAGAPEYAVCPSSMENEYRFIFYQQDLNGKKEKKFDMFCPTHGFLYYINPPAKFEDAEDEFFAKLQARTMNSVSLADLFLAVCEKRRLTPSRIEMRDEGALWKKNGVAVKRGIHSAGEDMFTYSVAVLLFSTALQVLLMGWRGIRRALKKED